MSRERELEEALKRMVAAFDYHRSDVPLKLDTQNKRIALLEAQKVLGSLSQETIKQAVPTPDTVAFQSKITPEGKIQVRAISHRELYAGEPKPSFS